MNDCDDGFIKTTRAFSGMKFRYGHLFSLLTLATKGSNYPMANKLLIQVQY